MAGLKRRKLALEMLGAAIQTGLDQRNTDRSGIKDDKDSAGLSSNNKRKAEADPSLQNENQTGGGEEGTEPATKKARTTGPT